MKRSEKRRAKRRCPPEPYGAEPFLAHTLLRGSLAEQKSRSTSARRRVAGLALGAATSTTSVLVIAGNPSLVGGTRCAGRIATSDRMLTPMPTETAAWMPRRLGLV